MSRLTHEWQGVWVFKTPPDSQTLHSTHKENQVLDSQLWGRTFLGSGGLGLWDFGIGADFGGELRIARVLFWD